MSKVFSGDQPSTAARGRKRNAFLLAHKKVFLPLLPEGNYIRKMADTPYCQKGEAVKYESIREQPKGYVRYLTGFPSIQAVLMTLKRVRALLRPHQMEGLSFLVYLRKNGAGGILGDEMGLGKTLQILSFFQYTRENEGEKYGSGPISGGVPAERTAGVGG
jgi:SWI/SNF-related matrix-associated actin-dependent regulator of chromatin subfamily A member 5